MDLLILQRCQVSCHPTKFPLQRERSTMFSADAKEERERPLHTNDASASYHHTQNYAYTLKGVTGVGLLKTKSCILFQGQEEKKTQTDMREG